MKVKLHYNLRKVIYRLELGFEERTLREYKEAIAWDRVIHYSKLGWERTGNEN